MDSDVSRKELLGRKDASPETGRSGGVRHSNESEDLPSELWRTRTGYFWTPWRIPWHSRAVLRAFAYGILTRDFAPSISFFESQVTFLNSTFTSFKYVFKNFIIFFAGEEGLEPSTSGFGGRRSTS